MIDFKEALLRFVAPRLGAIGYEYDDVLRDREIMFGFRKHLGDDVHTLILFQRQQYDELPVGQGFTISLVRCKTMNPAQWYRGGYEGYLNLRLPLALSFVYGVGSTHSYSDHWWIPTKEDKVETQFTDALDKLEKYGIPWLEDPSSRIPRIPDTRLTEFYEALSKIVSPELEQFGYGTIMDFEGYPHYFLSRKFSDDLTAFIVFELGGDPGYKKLVFNILLTRNRGSRPSYGLHQRCEEGALYQSLGVLLWEKAGLRIGPYRYVDWEYSNRKELEEQLKDAVEKIKDYAIPWLETPVSRLS